MVQTINKLDTSKQIIYFSRFNPEADVGGGARRTAQIAEALKSLDFAFVSSRDYPWDYKRLPDYPDYVQSGGLPTGYIEKWQPIRRDDIAFMHYVSWRWSNTLKDSTYPKLVLVDDPIYFFPLVMELALKGVPMVALCQNFESLSRSQLIDEHQMELFSYELGIMACCALVVTISREETVLLRNLGVDAFYFPYYPVKDIQERMTRISEKRQGTKKQDFLLVGTADNPPTMNGMEEIIRQWSSINKSLEDARLFVAGYGSGPLNDLCDGKGVVFKGTLSDEDLDSILAQTNGCIAYQEDGAGALTKISEFLLAGVPVTANSHAARTYYDVPGVVEFARIDDLGTALKMVYATEMTVRAPAPPDVSFLARRINDLLGAEGTAKAARIREVAEAMPPAGALAAGLDASMSRELLRKAAQFDALQAEFDAIKAHRNELLNSLSWRITAPLRYMAKFFLKR